MLSARIRKAGSALVAALEERGEGGTLRDWVERMEARVLRETLMRHGWNQSRAADALRLSRVGLRARLDRFGIERPAGAGEEEASRAAQ